MKVRSNFNYSQHRLPANSGHSDEKCYFRHRVKTNNGLLRYNFESNNN